MVLRGLRHDFFREKTCIHARVGAQGNSELESLGARWRAIEGCNSAAETRVHRVPAAECGRAETAGVGIHAGESAVATVRCAGARGGRRRGEKQAGARAIDQTTTAIIFCLVNSRNYLNAKG